jgi:hypothetical protein
MVKRWQMAEKGDFAPLPIDQPKGGRKGLLRWFASFYLAALLFFLTACVDLLNTCTPPWLFAFNPPSPTVNGSGCYTDGRQAPAGSPGLACLFLHALSATKPTILSFALSWLIFLQNVLPHWRPSFSVDAASPCPIRAPPCGAFAG